MILKVLDLHAVQGPESHQKQFVAKMKPKTKIIYCVCKVTQTTYEIKKKKRKKDKKETYNYFNYLQLQKSFLCKYQPSRNRRDFFIHFTSLNVVHLKATSFTNSICKRFYSNCTKNKSLLFRTVGLGGQSAQV